jgi:hypothetical protein
MAAISLNDAIKELEELKRKNKVLEIIVERFVFQRSPIVGSLIAQKQTGAVEYLNDTYQMINPYIERA